MERKEWEGSKWAEVVVNQGINPTMDKRLIITVCPVGAPVSRKQNRHQPRTPKEIAQETIASYKEGAAVWMVPHKNELSKSNADETRKIATIAREPGRDVATPDQARKLMCIR